MEFCGEPVWDWNLTWVGTANPDFTRCFQDTCLIWTPCAAFLVLSVFELLLNRQRRPRLPWTALLVVKVVICAVLILVQICDLWHVTHLPQGYYPSQFWSPLIQLSTMVGVIALIVYNKTRGEITSISLFVFWLIYAVSSGIRFRSALLGIVETEFVVPSRIRSVLASLTFPLVVAQFILHCFADKRLSHYAGNEVDQSGPENDASILSVFWFWWFNGLIALGYRRTKQGFGLRLDDLWELSDDNKTEGVIKKFSPHYEAEVGNGKGRSSKKENDDGTLIPENQINIIKPLFKTFGWNLFGVALIKLVTSLLTFVSPSILNSLITFVSSEDPLWKGVFLASVMLFSAMLESILTSQYEYRIYRIAMRARSALTYAIYCKALKLSSQAKGQFTTGEILTLMSVDSQRIMDYVCIMNLLWSVPLQIGVSIYLLWQQLGIATLGGLMVMIVLMPVNGVATAFIRKYQVSLMQDKDKRTKLMNEVLNGIKVLKLYAWEGSFMQRITNYRSKELSSLKSQAWLNGSMVFAFTSAPFLVALASFAVFVLSDPKNVLDANKAFVSLSLFNILSTPSGLLPILITFTAMFFVSLARINKYLRCGELDGNAVTKIQGSSTAVSIKDGTFQYGPEDPEPVLKDINMEIKKGQLVAVVGTVGTGKSTLLGALLGDVVKKSGNVTVSGSVAYVPQQAWIQGTSIKNNILFGSKYDRARYEQILDLCALRADLAILPGGDETEVGEKGINLSGGQKQRISVARAVYANSDVYYFDDPLSAVDSHVSKHIFDNVISNKGTLTSKTRILVTHQLSLLADCDLVYVIKDGTISEWGTYKQLVARKGAFADFLVQHLQERAGCEEISEEDVKIVEEIVKEGAVPPRLMKQLSMASGGDSDTVFDVGRRGSRQRAGSATSSVRSEEPRIFRRDSEENEKRARPGAALTKEEEAAVGSVEWKVYKDYLVVMGALGSAITLIAFVVSSAFNILTSLWLSAWSGDAADPQLRNSTSQRDYRLGIYAVWGTGEAVAALVASISLNLIALRGARVLHERMLERVLRAPMSFFDTTPMGRILNRFSKDIDTADLTMGANLRLVVQQICATAASLVLISIQTPIFLLLALPLVVIYFVVQNYYIATSRHLKRLESTSRSPVYVHFSETLTGCSSIRAYGAERRFIDISCFKTDINHKALYPSVAASRWLSMRLEFLGYVIVFLAASLAVLARGSLSPGYAGLSITAALTITQTLSTLVHYSSIVETDFISIERCLEYAGVGVEADWIVENNRPDQTWPTDGAIDFNNYSTRYRDGLPLVVRNISVHILPGEKVGVVGRTAAGKSSLTLALFRLIEAAEGFISIDALDISRIGLHDLRSKLTIIPQDPVLFSGTLRENLDPFGSESDEAVWAALEQAHLKDFVTGLERGLSHEVTEGGENISLGQRQLVCLARALLRKTKILILDEATAAVDMETDNLIQETLKKEFKDSTTLTIAHRLNTIVDYDRILVLSEGQVMEYDSPAALLKDPNSLFFAMAKDAGLV